MGGERKIFHLAETISGVIIVSEARLKLSFQASTKTQELFAIALKEEVRFKGTTVNKGTTLRM